jgi:hypothetical protein
MLYTTVLVVIWIYWCNFIIWLIIAFYASSTATPRPNCLRRQSFHSYLPTFSPAIFTDAFHTIWYRERPWRHSLFAHGYLIFASAAYLHASNVPSCSRNITPLCSRQPHTATPLLFIAQYRLPHYDELHFYKMSSSLLTSLTFKISWPYLRRFFWHFYW